MKLYGCEDPAFPLCSAQWQWTAPSLRCFCPSDITWTSCKHTCCEGRPVQYTRVPVQRCTSCSACTFVQISTTNAFVCIDANILPGPVACNLCMHAQFRTSWIVFNTIAWGHTMNFSSYWTHQSCCGVTEVAADVVSAPQA